MVAHVFSLYLSLDTHCENTAPRPVSEEPVHTANAIQRLPLCLNPDK
jgi:hypothetical protein